MSDAGGTRWGKQTEEALAAFAPDDVAAKWNNSSWRHLILLAAGRDPFDRDEDGEPPTPEERGSAIKLLRLALSAVCASSLVGSMRALEEWEAQNRPAPEVRKRLEAMTEGTFFASLASNLREIAEAAAQGETHPLREAMSDYGIESAKLWLVARRVAENYQASPIEPLSRMTLLAIFESVGDR